MRQGCSIETHGLAYRQKFLQSYRKAVNAGCIHQAMSEIFYSYEIRPLNVGSLEVGLRALGLLVWSDRPFMQHHAPAIPRGRHC